jgi:hypothetical protein
MRASRLALFRILKKNHTPDSTAYHKRSKTSIIRFAKNTGISEKALKATPHNPPSASPGKFVP